MRTDDADSDEFLADLGLEEPGLNRVIRAGYRLLGLQTYFTAGKGSARLDGAGGRHRAAGRGVIHTDFEKGFIRAEASPTTTSSPTTARRAPRRPALRLEGKDYVVKDGDVMHFRFNV